MNTHERHSLRSALYVVVLLASGTLGGQVLGYIERRSLDVCVHEIRLTGRNITLETKTLRSSFVKNGTDVGNGILPAVYSREVDVEGVSPEMQIIEACSVARPAMRLGQDRSQ